MGTEIGKDTAAPATTATARPLRRVWGWRALPLVLAVVLGLGLLLWPAPTARSAPQAPDFILSAALRDQQGRTVALSRLRGKVVALTFVSSIGTEQCPLVSKGLSQARHDLGRAGAHLTIVAISVAPERDTPQTVRHFAALSGWQGADWHYLSAPRVVLARIWAAPSLWWVDDGGHDGRLAGNVSVGWCRLHGPGWHAGAGRDA